MCLAVQGKVVSVKDGVAVIDCNGEKRQAIAKGAEIRPGDSVLVQFGVVVEKISGSNG